MDNLTYYSLGLVFSCQEEGELNHLLLLQKKKPPSQAGRYNGVGGHFEEGEDWRSCIVRETWEEASLRTHPKAWIRVGALYKPNKWLVHVAFTSVTSGTLRTVPPSCNEGTFLIAPLDHLPPNIMTNLRWMIPLIQGFNRERQEEFIITYLPDADSEDEEV